MLRKTVVARALSIAFSTAALTVAVSSRQWRSRTRPVTSSVASMRRPAPRSTVDIDTGLKRTVTPDANGASRSTALPIGHYKD